MYADISLDNKILKELIKKVPRANRRQLISDLQQRHTVSVSRACKLMSVSKTMVYYKSKKKTDDLEISLFLTSLAELHIRWGFDKMMRKVKLEKKPWNHKRVYRVYCKLKLNIRIKQKKRLPLRQAKLLVQPINPNVCWSIDFMSDVLRNGRRFKIFNVIDDCNREGLLIKPNYSLPTKQVTRLLDRVALERGSYPDIIRVDNGPEFISVEFKGWAEQHQVLVHYIQPGKHSQNAFIARFNRTYREDVLDMNLFFSLCEVREITHEWLKIL